MTPGTILKAEQKIYLSRGRNATIRDCLVLQHCAGLRVTHSENFTRRRQTRALDKHIVFTMSWLFKRRLTDLSGSFISYGYLYIYLPFAESLLR